MLENILLEIAIFFEMVYIRIGSDNFFGVFLFGSRFFYSLFQRFYLRMPQIIL